MVSEEDRMRRLAFAKYLIEMGSINADNVLPYSATALLNFHDALEFLFDLILDDNGIYPKPGQEFYFMTMFNKCNGVLKKKGLDESSFGASLNKLKNKRVDIKHKGSFPSPQDIDEAKYTAMNLFKDFCFKLYGLNYEDINLIDLLDDSRTKECLLGIDYEDNHVNIVADLALAFELLLKDFEESKRSPFGFSPYQFLKKDQLSSSNLGIADIKPIKNYVDRTNENLKSLNENMKILALGIDYNKYVQFKFLIPANIYWIFGSDEPQIYVGDFEPLTKKKIEFCKNFIIETALKLQQFDFNFKID